MWKKLSSIDWVNIYLVSIFFSIDVSLDVRFVIHYNWNVASCRSEALRKRDSSTGVSCKFSSEKIFRAAFCKTPRGNCFCKVLNFIMFHSVFHSSSFFLVLHDTRHRYSYCQKFVSSFNSLMEEKNISNILKRHFLITYIFIKDCHVNFCIFLWNMINYTVRYFWFLYFFIIGKICY